VTQQTRRDVPTLIHDGEAWVRASDYDRAVETRENANKATLRAEWEAKQARAVLAGVADVLDRGVPDDRKLATITRLVHATTGSEEPHG
jgi:hypothetical protein